jgi:SAM-dependent methyltransferase
MPAVGNARDGYNPSFFERLARIEDRHFWFRFRNRLISCLVRDLGNAFPAGFRKLEAGCGNGNVLRFLTATLQHASVIGIDLFEEGLRLARGRSDALLVRGDIHASPFQCQFQVIGAFDVIEHLHDDRQALRDLHRLLADDGFLLLTVPSHMVLWSYFDEASGHCRRYSRKQLEQTLDGCGFRVEFMTEFMMVLYPVLWIGRRLSGWLRGSKASSEPSLTDLRVFPVLNSILLLLVSWELPLIRRRIRIPLGSSLLAIARRA